MRAFEESRRCSHYQGSSRLSTVTIESHLMLKLYHSARSSATLVRQMSPERLTPVSLSLFKFSKAASASWPALLQHCNVYCAELLSRSYTY